MQRGPLAPVVLTTAILSFVHAPAAPGQAPAEAGVYAIEGVTVVPMTSDTVLENRTVIVRGGRIAAICPAADRCRPGNAVTIDGSGKFLIPALADMHNHFGGFAFDGRDETRVRMRNQNLRQYVMFGVASWGVMDGNPPLFRGTRSFSTPAAAADFVRQTASNGSDLVKVYSALSLEVFDAVMKTAKKVGLPVAAHVPMAVPLDHALDQGLRSIEHLTGYDVACAAPDVTMHPVTKDIYQGWAWCAPAKVKALAELTTRHEPPATRESGNIPRSPAASTGSTGSTAPANGPGSPGPARSDSDS